MRYSKNLEISSEQCLNHKTALITGGSKGIGAALAQVLATNLKNVVISKKH
jgi:NAD(P)-dependent dehydrogenase (short-subunit alcohol dehydrogenase family)